MKLVIGAVFLSVALIFITADTVDHSAFWSILNNGSPQWQEYLGGSIKLTQLVTAFYAFEGSMLICFHYDGRKRRLV